MFNTFRELVHFYSQKFNVAMFPIWSNYIVYPENQPGIIVAYATDGEEKTIGDSLVRYNPEFGKDFEGLLIDIEGIPLIKIGDNFLFLLFKPDNAPAEELMKRLIDEYLPKLARKYKKSLRQQFIHRMMRCATSRKGTLSGQVAADEYELENLCRRVTELSTKISTAKHLLKFFEKSDDYLKKFALQMWVDLLKLVPGVYQGFRFEDDSIFGLTHRIVIQYDGEDYEFEPYEVEFDIRNARINIRGERNGVNGYIHPHITEDTVCWGSIGGLVAKLIGQVDLHGLFQLVHTFLSSYNPEDPYQRVERWDPDYEEPDEEDDEYCVYCEEYGHEANYCSFCYWCYDCNEFHCNEEPCPNKVEVEVEVQTA